MLAVTDDELAALYPLVRRLGPIAIIAGVTAAFLLTALVILALGGTLVLAGVVLASELAGAAILFAGIYGWCVLEDSAERAHREISASSPSPAASGRFFRAAA